MKKVGLVAWCCIFILVFAGCGGPSYSSDNGSMNTGVKNEVAGAPSVDSNGFYEEGYYEYEPSIVPEEGTGNNSTEVQSSSRKLITTRNLDVEVENFTTFSEWLEREVVGVGGYVEYSSSYLNGTSMYGDWTLRIPDENLDSFTSSVGSASNVISKSTRVEDITLQYTDTESHKKALLTEQERLLELLENAFSLEDVLSIEDRLTYVRYELENYESLLRSYDNQVDFSTLTLSVREVREYTEPEPEGFLETLKRNFEESWKGVKGFWKDAVVALASTLPWFMVVYAPVIVIVVLYIVWWRNRKKRKKKESLMKKIQAGEESVGAESKEDTKKEL